MDGVDDTPPGAEESERTQQPGTPRQASRRHNIDTDDTAKYYRRFFLGMVSSLEYFTILITGLIYTEMKPGLKYAVNSSLQCTQYTKRELTTPSF